MTQPAEPVQEFWYSPQNDQGDDVTERYRCRSLDGMQTAEVMSEMNVEDGRLFASAKAIRMAINMGLIGWDGLCEENGQPIKYSPSNIGRVPSAHLIQIANRIINGASLTEDERKNS